LGEITEALRHAREQRSSPDTGRQRPAPPREATRASRTHSPDPGGEGLTPAGSAAPAEASAAHFVEALAPPNHAIVLQGPAVETFRGIALRVRRELDARGAASAAIVSGLRDEGKTTVLCDLGLALASLSGGHNVALVDLDLRKPSIASGLGIPADRGIEEVLRGGATLDDVRISIGRLRIDLYPAVEPQRNAHELLASPSFAAMIGELEQRYAVVLFDTPPTLLLPDTGLILQHVATCIVIARSGQTRVRYFRQLIAALPKHRILGELLNDTNAPRHSYGHYYGNEDSASDSTKAEEPRSARQP
jgi:Mrp family chromosome partitioning ATPase